MYQKEICLVLVAVSAVSLIGLWAYWTNRMNNLMYGKNTKKKRRK